MDYTNSSSSDNKKTRMSSQEKIEAFIVDDGSKETLQEQSDVKQSTIITLQQQVGLEESSSSSVLKPMPFTPIVNSPSPIGSDKSSQMTNAQMTVSENLSSVPPVCTPDVPVSRLSIETLSQVKIIEKPKTQLSNTTKVLKSSASSSITAHQGLEEALSTVISCGPATSLLRKVQLQRKTELERQVISARLQSFISDHKSILENSNLRSTKSAQSVQVKVENAGEVEGKKKSQRTLSDLDQGTIKSLLNVPTSVSVLAPLPQPQSTTLNLANDSQSSVNITNVKTSEVSDGKITKTFFVVSKAKGDPQIYIQPGNSLPPLTNASKLGNSQSSTSLVTPDCTSPPEEVRTKTSNIVLMQTNSATQMKSSNDSSTVLTALLNSGQVSLVKKSPAISKAGMPKLNTSTESPTSMLSVGKTGSVLPQAFGFLKKSTTQPIYDSSGTLVVESSDKCRPAVSILPEKTRNQLTIMPKSISQKMCPQSILPSGSKAAHHIVLKDKLRNPILKIPITSASQVVSLTSEQISVFKQTVNQGNQISGLAKRSPINSTSSDMKSVARGNQQLTIPTSMLHPTTSTTISKTVSPPTSTTTSTNRGTKNQVYSTSLQTAQGQVPVMVVTPSLDDDDDDDNSDTISLPEIPLPQDGKISWEDSVDHYPLSSHLDEMIEQNHLVPAQTSNDVFQESVPMISDSDMFSQDEADDNPMGLRIESVFSLQKPDQMEDSSVKLENEPEIIEVDSETDSVEAEDSSNSKMPTSFNLKNSSEWKSVVSPSYIALKKLSEFDTLARKHTSKIVNVFPPGSSHGKKKQTATKSFLHHLGCGPPPTLSIIRKDLKESSSHLNSPSDTLQRPTPSTVKAKPFPKKRDILDSVSDRGVQVISDDEKSISSPAFEKPTERKSSDNNIRSRNHSTLMREILQSDVALRVTETDKEHAKPISKSKNQLEKGAQVSTPTRSVYPISRSLVDTKEKISVNVPFQDSRIIEAKISPEEPDHRTPSSEKDLSPYRKLVLGTSAWGGFKQKRMSLSHQVTTKRLLMSKMKHIRNKSLHSMDPQDVEKLDEITGSSSMALPNVNSLEQSQNINAPAKDKDTNKKLQRALQSLVKYVKSSGKKLTEGCAERFLIKVDDKHYLVRFPHNGSGPLLATNVKGFTSASSSKTKAPLSTVNAQMVKIGNKPTSKIRKRVAKRSTSSKNNSKTSVSPTPVPVLLSTAHGQEISRFSPEILARPRVTGCTNQKQYADPESPLSHVPSNSSLLPQRKRPLKVETKEMRQLKRKCLENKYPMPPGVVIKSEPVDRLESVESTEIKTLQSSEDDKTDARHSVEDRDVDMSYDEPPPLTKRPTDKACRKARHGRGQGQRDDAPPVLEPMVPATSSSLSPALMEDSSKPSLTTISTISRKTGLSQLGVCDQNDNRTGSSSSSSVANSHSLSPTTLKFEPRSQPMQVSTTASSVRIQRLKELLKKREMEFENMRKMRSELPSLNLDDL